MGVKPCAVGHLLGGVCDSQRRETDAGINALVGLEILGMEGQLRSLFLPDDTWQGHLPQVGDPRMGQVEVIL